MILKRWGFLIALPLIALMWLGVYDYRYLVVALMILFIIYPMLLPLLYINYMLRPQVRAIVFPQRATVDADGRLTVEYLPEEPPAPADDDDPLLPALAPGSYIPAPLVVSPDDVTDVSNHGPYLKVTIRNPYIFFVFIPRDMIEYCD